MHPRTHDRATHGLDLLKWIGLLIFLECFDYKAASLAWNAGITITPDRVVFLIILTLAVGRVLSGDLRFASLGRAGSYMLLFAVVCTASSIVNGSGVGKNGRHLGLTMLFDFIYAPLILFLVAKSIPHSRRKLVVLSSTFLLVGAYLAINGAFEHFGLNALVWPKYILDPSVGIQFGRTRGPFGSSSALGGALVVCFIFHVLSTTRVREWKLYWVYMMLPITAGVIYTTNTRAAWLCFALCIVLLAIVRSGMKNIARVVAGGICLFFFSGVASHFSFEGGTLFSKRQETLEYRWVNNMTLLEMSKTNPIFGIGWGNFRTEWSKYFHSSSEDDIRELTDGNHNTFLGLLAEVGLIGTLPYLMILYTMFRVGLRVFRGGGGLEREFALIFLLVVSVYVIDANFGDARNTQFLNAVLFLLFGTVARVEGQLRLRHRIGPVGKGEDRRPTEDRQPTEDTQPTEDRQPTEDKQQTGVQPHSTADEK
jgi:O-antigen ligase